MNAQDLMDFAREWVSLGTAVQEQVQGVLGEGIYAEVNQNAIRLAHERLKRVFSDDCEPIEEITDELAKWLGSKGDPDE